MESSGVSGITGIDVSDNQMSDDIAVIITPATEIFILDDFIVAVTAVSVVERFSERGVLA